MSDDEVQEMIAERWHPCWRPISEAPRDGSTITVRYYNGAPYHVFWKFGGWIPVEHGVPREPTEWSANRWLAAICESDRRRAIRESRFGGELPYSMWATSKKTDGGGGASIISPTRHLLAKGGTARGLTEFAAAPKNIPEGLNEAEEQVLASSRANPGEQT